VSHCGLATYIKKYLNAKEELWKLKYFTMQKIIFQKSSGAYMMDEFLAPKILDLFEKAKGISHAHIMGAPCGDASISTL